MKKKIYFIPIMLIILFILSSFQLKIQAADRTVADLFFEIFYQTEKNENEILKILEKCSDTELKNLINYNEYYIQRSDHGKEEIQAAMKKYDEAHPEGGSFDYERWEEVKNAMQPPFMAYKSSIERILNERKNGAGVGEQDDEKAKEIAEQIKTLYEEVKGDIQNADVEKLKKIDSLMLEVYKKDSGVKDIYEGSEMTNIRGKVAQELKRRDPNYKTTSEQTNQSGVELEEELEEERQNRVGLKTPDPLDSYSPTDKKSPDDIISEGSDFLQAGKNNQNQVSINGEKVTTASDLIFNIAFAAGIGVAAVVGTYLGVKFMLGGTEEKANIKESLIPYFMGAIIMFASFSIWKLILVLLQAIDNI